MKQFKHIEIHREYDVLMDLLEKMKSIKDGDFLYNEEMSRNTNEGTKNDSVCDGTIYAVFTTSKTELYCTNVFVSVKDNVLKVFNMTSNNNDYWDLGVSRYNFVLNVFFHHFMAKCLDESYGGSIRMTGEELKMGDIIGEDAYNALKRWEEMCNKEAPTSHYYDEQAWFEFLYILHREGKTLHPSDLESWLSEDCGWPICYNEVINKIGRKLEYSLSLLNYYGERSSR